MTKQPPSSAESSYGKVEFRLERDPDDKEGFSGPQGLVDGPVSGVMDLGDADLVIETDAVVDGVGDEVGDVSGDGYDDLALCDPQDETWARYSGVVRLHPGPILSAGTEAAWMLEDVGFRIDGSRDMAGLAVAGGQDVDGDGYDDVLIGAPMWTDPEWDGSGAVALFYGGPGA